MKASDFLEKDGYVNVKEITTLAKEIDKFAAKEGMKGAEIYFAPKLITKFDAAKLKDKGDAFTRKRAQIIKTKSKMPATGSRMKMQVLLRNYKGLDDTDFAKDFEAAKKALDMHHKAAEKFQESFKKASRKASEAASKQHDKAVDELIDILKDAGLSEDDIAIGKSTMGKTMVVCVGKGLYVSIGKADETKFEKTLDSLEEDEDEKPAKKAKKADKADKKEKKGDKKSKKEMDKKVVKKVAKKVEKLAKKKK